MKCCRRIMDLIPDYGELPADVRRYVDDHLADCSACAEAFAVLQELDGRLAGLRGHVPGNFADQVLSRIQREETDVQTTRLPCRVLGAVIVAELVVIACFQHGFRSFSSGLVGAIAPVLRERVIPVLTGLWQTIASEAGRLRLPALSGNVNWLQVTRGLIILLVFAVLTIHQGGKRHA